jgi:DNA repair exonuclease SbcCD ATPase subunit
MVLEYFSVNPSDANLHNEPANGAEQELAQLRRQLQLRDQLVEQLSTELFRMVKAHPPALPGSTSTSSALVPQTVENTLRDDLRQLEQQIEFYQSQIDKRDQEIGRLQKSCQTLSDRNQMLERIIQELPEVYRQKFADRLDVVKSKFQSLQTENRRLHGELQQVNARSLPEAKGSKKSG